MDNPLSTFLSRILSQSPVYLTMLVGMLLAWLRWPRHPRISRVLILALSLALLTSILVTAIIAWLYQVLSNYGWDSKQVVGLYGYIAFANSLINAVIWTMVYYAVFSDRSETKDKSSRRQLRRSSRGQQDCETTSTDADRNLLFGIMALQMNFLSDEQLIAAVSLWVKEKPKPLDRMLVDLRIITSDERELLKGVVEKHLLRHGNKPRESLAVLRPIGTLQKQLESFADSELMATLSHVAFVHGDDFNDDETIAAEAKSPNRSISERTSASRFRIIRPHARGGLGEVFVAHDEELGREVALKQIQQNYADHKDSRIRFVQEAEITGGLEHPGIVPVYGLGTYTDGRPYYAMRFIRGDSLKEAIEDFYKAGVDAVDSLDRSPQFRKLLGRFIDICNAIEYAHSRGVLHRDLKPGNVMLGKYGETLVVDWGLAKTVGKDATQSDSEEPTLKLGSGSGSNPTQLGSAIGTPSFMSPEQAAGRIDEIGAASDIYSLGATLYCLLTGQSAFKDANVVVVLQKVINGDFPKPRKIRSSVPLALEAICLKAMAKEPDDRYSSASELAEDIENWLADETVSACPDPWNVRIARTIRRHPVMTTATAAGMFGAIFTLTLIFSIRAPQLLRDSMNPSSMKDLLQQAQNAEHTVDVPDLTRLVFAAGSANENGTPGEKRRAYKRAIVIQERLVIELPDTPQVAYDLAEFYDHAARFSSSSLEFRDALDYFTKAIELRSLLVQELPQVPTLKLRLAAVYADAAWLLATCPDPSFRDGAQAINFAKHAIEINDANNSVYLDTLAASYAQVGEFEQAAETERLAIASAKSESKDEYSRRLQLYIENMPYAESEKIFPSKIH